MKAPFYFQPVLLSSAVSIDTLTSVGLQCTYSSYTLLLHCAECRLRPTPSRIRSNPGLRSHDAAMDMETEDVKVEDIKLEALDGEEPSHGESSHQLGGTRERG